MASSRLIKIFISIWQFKKFIYLFIRVPILYTIIALIVTLRRLKKNTAHICLAILLYLFKMKYGQVALNIRFPKIN